MPSRNYSSDKYRYGFNGKEKDKDLNSLTAYDYGFRIYNPAIGKFMSVDPLMNKYPELTPYQFAADMPIIAIDIDGLEGKIVTIYHGTNEQVILTTEKFSKSIPTNTVQTVHKFYEFKDGKARFIDKKPESKLAATGVDANTGRIEVQPEPNNQNLKPSGSSSFDKFVMRVFESEGGSENNFTVARNDRGGATKFGITIGTFKMFAKKDLGVDPTLENLGAMTKEQAAKIYKTNFWDKFNGDAFVNGSVAYQVYDWSVTSGGAFKQIEKVAADMGISIKIDGNLTNEEVKLINTLDQKALFENIKKNRLEYYQNIVDKSVAEYLAEHPNASKKELKNKTQKYNENGWRNRANRPQYSEN